MNREIIIVEPFIYAGLKIASQVDARIAMGNNPEHIVSSVCRHFKIDAVRLLSHTRVREVSYPRIIAIHKIRKTSGMTLKEIGKMFGGRDHSTILYSLETYGDLMKYDKQFQKMVSGYEENTRKEAELKT